MNYFDTANNYYIKKDYKSALMFYEKAIGLQENLTSALYNAAVCLIKLKDYEKAIHLLKRAIHFRNESKYFFNLAYCNMKLKNKRKALIYFNTAWSLDNSDSDCEKAISMIIKSYNNNFKK
ncbi:MAG: CDC27 family protein [Clostridium sp.]|nr:CDC27 family protein [Clostridium sp.]